MLTLVVTVITDTFDKVMSFGGNSYVSANVTSCLVCCSVDLGVSSVVITLVITLGALTGSS